MARSKKIYLVSESNAGIVAAFTVKHEMLTWIDRNDGEYKLYTIPDGGGDRPKEFLHE